MPKSYVGLCCGDSQSLVSVSDFHSQIEGTEFDGPILFDDMTEAEEALVDCPEGYRPVVVTVSVREIPAYQKKSDHKSD